MNLCTSIVLIPDTTHPEYANSVKNTFLAAITEQIRLFVFLGPTVQHLATSDTRGVDLISAWAAKLPSVTFVSPPSPCILACLLRFD